LRLHCDLAAEDAQRRGATLQDARRASRLQRAACAGDGRGARSARMAVAATRCFATSVFASRQLTEASHG
jgi:hypothetical protein